MKEPTANYYESLSHSNINMVKRHRFVTPLEDLSPEWITHTEYVLGDKFINFGFFDPYSLKYRERTLKFHGWKHKGLMRRGILPLTPT